ncbi:MAG TPA: DsbA family protein [Magnetospirillaceae bacterium]
MTAPILYLFDPFCGWCYAAAPQIARLREAVGKDKVQGLPTGLFGGDGQTPMTPEFRDYAWSNDQRIAQMTGQPFSQTYYDDVLSNFSAPFDSGPATKAIAVAETMKADSGLDLLARLQKARFVEGKNLFDTANIFTLVADIGLDRKAFETAYDSADGDEAMEETVHKGQIMMHRLGLRGVPALVVSHGDHHHPVSGDKLINPQSGLIETLAAQYGPDASPDAADHHHH